MTSQDDKPFSIATTKALMLHSAEQSNIKVNNDAAQAATLLLESFISECVNRAANVARTELENDIVSSAASNSNGNSSKVNVQPVHIEATLPKLLLDFS